MESRLQSAVMATRWRVKNRARPQHVLVRIDPATVARRARRIIGRRAAQYSLATLFLIAGAIMLATGRPVGIGFALLLSALALLMAPSPDRDASSRRRY